MRAGRLALVVFAWVAVAGCRAAGERNSAATTAPAAAPASLRITQHTGARAGNVPAHVAWVEVDGVRHPVTNDVTLDLLPGRHDVTVGYERCFHAPTQLVPRGTPRELPIPRGRVAFDATPGATYVIGCNPGGGGVAVPNAHWVDQLLPAGRRRRVADGTMGGDFPPELLGREPPPPRTRPR